MEGVRVAPEDYQPPFPLTAKLNKLTIRVDRPELSPEDINKLEEAQRNNKMRE
jgi:arylsulfatase